MLTTTAAQLVAAAQVRLEHGSPAPTVDDLLLGDVQLVDVHETEEVR